MSALIRPIRRYNRCVLQLWLAAAFCWTAGAEGVDLQLERLHNTDPEVRLQALRELQTSLDPRIPDVLLPLLFDEGDSIRRLAARAIGSRWWQIPQEQVPVYVRRLSRKIEPGDEGEQNMVRRALGLLRRDYSSNMFAPSADGRWVIYERRGFPCLIDTTSGTEELLGWSYKSAAQVVTGNYFGADRSGWLISSWGNEPLTSAAYWHPKEPLVALLMLVNRKTSSLWIWRHGAALRELEIDDILNALKLREADMHFAGGFFISVEGWRDEELRFEVQCARRDGEQFVEQLASMAWDSAAEKLRLITRKEGERY